MNGSQVWQRKAEGLQLTTKESKELPGGRRLHVTVAIAAGKGVIFSVPYDKMSGHFYDHLCSCGAEMKWKEIVCDGQ